MYQHEEEHGNETAEQRLVLSQALHERPPLHNLEETRRFERDDF